MMKDDIQLDACDRGMIFIMWFFIMMVIIAADVWLGDGNFVPDYPRF